MNTPPATQYFPGQQDSPWLPAAPPSSVPAQAAPAAVHPSAQSAPSVVTGYIGQPGSAPAPNAYATDARAEVSLVSNPSPDGTNRLFSVRSRGQVPIQGIVHWIAYEHGSVIGQGDINFYVLPGQDYFIGGETFNQSVRRYQITSAWK